MESKVSNLIPYKKGETGNPHGRPRKFVTTLKESGYKLHEINDCIQVMLQMTLSELAEVLTDDNATILEKTIANAMRNSLKKGSLYSIDTLLSRVFGKPKEQVETKNLTALTGKITIEVKNSNIPLSNRETDVDIKRDVSNN